jgi:hypothetical protein
MNSHRFMSPSSSLVITAIWAARLPEWVKSGKTRYEHLVSAFDLIADEQADIRAGQLSANRVGLAVLARVK